MAAVPDTFMDIHNTRRDASEDVPAIHSPELSATHSPTLPAINSPGLPSNIGSPLRDDEETFDLDATHMDHLAALQAEDIKYHLRPSARTHANGGYTTYLDIDDSGDYNPNQKEESSPKKRKQPPIATREAELDATASVDQSPILKKARYSTSSAARQRGDRFVATISVKTDKIRHIVSTIPNNWPGEDEPIGDQFQSDVIKLLITNDPNTEEGEGSTYLFRSRAKEATDAKEPPMGQEPESQPAKRVIPDPSGLEDDLTGHPAARGCVSCRTLSLQCSLLDPNTSYPCFECTDDEIFCELITPPRCKQACEPCKALKQTCSYTVGDGQTGADHSQPCDQCQSAKLAAPDKSQIHCVAAPVPGTQPVRIPQGADWENRKFITCTACRQTKRRCSLKTKQDFPPCKSCLQDGVTCTFEEIIKAKKTTQPTLLCSGALINSDDEEADAGVEEEERQGSSEHVLEASEGEEGLFCTPPPPPLGQEDSLMIDDQAPQPPNEEVAAPSGNQVITTPVPKRRTIVEDTDGHRGYPLQLRTSLCHPITFGFQEQASAPIKCTWCKVRWFGITGYGPRDVYAMEWTTGLGYTELLDGHRCEGKSANIMCQICTLLRLRMIVCEGHTMSCYRSENVGSGDVLGQMAVSWKENRNAQQECCSVCTKAASYRCTTTQDYDMFMEPLKERVAAPLPSVGIQVPEYPLDDRDGCGLRLCEPCVVKLRTKGGDLNLLAMEAAEEEQNNTAMEADGSLRPSGWRADASLLFSEGLLMKNVIDQS